MTDLAFDDPCVLFALRREAAPFLREFRPQQRFPGSPCPARFCGPAWLSVLVLETGVGSAATARALEWLLAGPVLEKVPYRPKVVLCAGFCGALTADLQVGDIVLATEVLDAEGNVWPTTWPGELPAGEWRPPLHRTRLLTAARLVATPEEKRSLAERWSAAAVDLESAVAARLCKKHGVPFGCVRAVSDDWRTPLSPQLAAVLAGGRVSLGRVLALLARHPGRVRELWRLASATRRAAGQLGTALGELLTLTLPWGASL
jgi:adenosylhomocysteine nucleosidase